MHHNPLVIIKPFLLPPGANRKRSSGSGNFPYALADSQSPTLGHHLTSPHGLCLDSLLYFSVDQFVVEEMEMDVLDCEATYDVTSSMPLSFFILMRLIADR